MPNSIKDLAHKIKSSRRTLLSRVRVLPHDIFLGLLLILVALGAFGLGRLSVISITKTPIRIENMPSVNENTFSQGASAGTSIAPTIINTQNENAFVASKAGTKYYYPWCAGAQKIIETNRIYFSSKEEAETKGYTPSSACKGL